MKTENVITIICAVLGSGIISMLLQRYWSKVDEKKAEERAQSVNDLIVFCLETAISLE